MVIMMLKEKKKNADGKKVKLVEGGDMFKVYMDVFKANRSVFHRNLKQDLRL